MTAVLLLNASYEPLKVITWKRAVCLCFTGKVEVVEEYEHEIRSVSVAIKAPCVVRLLRYVRVGKRKPPLSRFNILARDQFSCQYCGMELSSKLATLDHVLPRSHGGRTTWENMVCSCQKCNLSKGARTPEQAGMKLRNKPKQPDWLPVLEFKLRGNVPQSWQIFLDSFR